MYKSLKRAAAAMALGAGASALLAGPALASTSGPVSISMRGTIAPNVFGSPSWDAFMKNAIVAMQTGKKVVGDPGPAQFRQVTNVTSRDLIVTQFPSWKGVADPGTAFGSAYANELGTRPGFVALVKPRTGRQIDVKNGLTFSLVGNGQGDVFNDAPETRNPPMPNGFTSYDNRLVGVRFGDDHKPGGTGANADQYLTSGTGAVDEIVSLRPGNADATDGSADNSTVNLQQGLIDAEVDWLRGLSGFTQLTGTVSFAHRTSDAYTLTVGR